MNNFIITNYFAFFFDNAGWFSFKPLIYTGLLNKIKTLLMPINHYDMVNTTWVGFCFKCGII